MTAIPSEPTWGQAGRRAQAAVKVERSEQRLPRSAGTLTGASTVARYQERAVVELAGVSPNPRRA